MEYFIISFLAFVIGFKVSEFIHVMSFKKILEELGVNNADLRRLLKDHQPEDSETSEVDAKLIDIRVEQINGQLFAYDTAQNLFLCQGQNADELVQRILQRFPTKTRIICSVDNGGELLSPALERIKTSS